MGKSVLKSIEKAKQIGAFGLERIGDYIDLIGLDIEIQIQDIERRAVSAFLLVVFGLLALLFLGAALIITFWNTEYRILVAWLVFAFYLLLAGTSYIIARRHTPVEPALKVIREEMKQDLNLLKHLLGGD